VVWQRHQGKLAIVRAGISSGRARPLLVASRARASAWASRDLRAGRGRPHARHGLHPGHQADLWRFCRVTAKRQNLLFSATFSGEIKKLISQLLNAPQLIEVAKRNTAPTP
jgi:hypothetical protein